jgi:branched-chain amino acid transport system substrate-binding protein
MKNNAGKFMKKRVVLALLPLFLCSCESARDAAESDILVGMLSPLTGPFANMGCEVARGAELYVREYNGYGGLNGRKIRLIERDDEGDSVKAVMCLNSLADEKACGVICGSSSVQALALAPESQRLRLPLMLAAATNDNVTYDSTAKILYPNVFRACFTDSVQGRKMAVFAKNYLKARTAAIIYCQENDYSSGLKDAFLSSAESLGIKIISTQGFAEKCVDFSGQLTNIAEKEPDVCFAPNFYEKMALIFPQARAAKIACPIIGTDSWSSILSLVEDAEILENSYYSCGFSAESGFKPAKIFAQSYVKAFEKKPNMYGALGYDAAKVLVSAVQKTILSGTEPQDSSFYAGIVENLKNTDVTGATGRTKFDSRNNPEKDVYAVKISGGIEKFLGEIK